MDMETSAASEEFTTERSEHCFRTLEIVTKERET